MIGAGTRRYAIFTAILLLIIFIDHTLKLWGHFNLEPYKVFKLKYIGWFISLCYVENPDLAFGITFDSKNFRYVCFFIRLLLITYILVNFTKKGEKMKKKCLIGNAMVCGGGISNTIDWIFYGKFLNNTLEGAPHDWFFGQVIDIFYLPFLDIKLPNFLPIIGDREIYYGVFNVADVCVISGLIILMFFCNDKSNKDNININKNEEKIV